MKIKLIIACLGLAFISCGEHRSGNNGASNSQEPGNYNEKVDQNPQENSAQPESKADSKDSSNAH
ncbi:MAG: hypothetical protein K0R26_2051 [Bacteroidota bacterium]|jgi:hypothetical protein|nr:hypothetical protein [Bacteroidota bacterium]